MPEYEGLTFIKGSSYLCVRSHCASKGNRVTAKHVHKFLPTVPMSNPKRAEVYLAQNGSGKLTVRQERAVRRAKRRSEGR